MGVTYAVNVDFFDSWSDEMAYVLGYLYADGSLEDASLIRGKYIRVSSTDLDRIQLLRRLIGSKHTVVTIDGRGVRKTQYLLRIGSSRLYARLSELGLTPAKSLTMRMPEVPQDNFSSFVLGYFDGDGCVSIEKGAGGSVKRLLTVFTSGSRDFLTSLHSLLVNRIGVVGNGLYKHGGSLRTYQLRYSTRDSLRLYQFLFSQSNQRSLAMHRKYAIFTEYFKMRGIQENDFLRILKSKGPVVKG